MIKVISRGNGLNSTFKRIQKLKSNYDSINAFIGEIGVKETKERIQSTKEDPQGNPWRPWSLATIKQRQREGNIARGLLYRTGNLFRSITYTITGKTTNLISLADYARFLQKGTPKMPARKFLGWSTKAINKIKQRLLKK